MKTLTLTVGESDGRFIYEALLALEQRWDKICSTSDDPDEVADYGNDLIELRLLLDTYKAQAVTAFGSGVLNLSREAL
jgi:hypothetical protein